MNMPSNCNWCGASLRGGATKHAPTCWLHPSNLERYISSADRANFPKDAKMPQRKKRK